MRQGSTHMVTGLGYGPNAGIGNSYWNMLEALWRPRSSLAHSRTSAPLFAPGSDRNASNTTSKTMLVMRAYLPG
eukprot:2896545-Pyramimonas_sp.AAC.1